MPLFALVLMAAYVIFGAGNSLAHHSFAMFDTDNPVELIGTVREFKYTNPHTFVVLEVKEDGASTTWSLEGASPSALVREGWSSTSIKPGDELKMTISPLRSGAPGGSWDVRKTTNKDGSPVLAHR